MTSKIKANVVRCPNCNKWKRSGKPLIRMLKNNTRAYNDFTFNAAGCGNISKTGISNLGVRNAKGALPDIDVYTSTPASNSRR